MKLDRIVEVTWEDAYTRTGWEHEKFYKEHGHGDPVVVRSVGYLLARDENRTTIVQSGNVDGRHNVDGSITIPTGCIKKIRVLRKKGN